LKGLSHGHLGKKKNFLKRHHYSPNGFSRRKSISFKNKIFHYQVHFENAMQGLVGSHDHLLGGLDVFPTVLNYV